MFAKSSDFLLSKSLISLNAFNFGMTMVLKASEVGFPDISLKANSEGEV